MNDSWEDVVKNCDYETKLAVTAWVMEKIVEHAKEGGSYRYLIYQRLGFDMDAYTVLLADGMTISNEFDLNLKDKVITAYRSGDEKEMKKALGLCDEPGCFKHITNGWPSENGYRTTCTEHTERE